MRRLFTFLLTMLMLFSLAACGQSTPADSSSPDESEDPAASPDEETPEVPEPEPYTILDPTVMPEGGVRGDLCRL